MNREELRKESDELDFWISILTTVWLFALAGTLVLLMWW